MTGSCVWGGSHDRKLCLGWVTWQEAVSGVGHMAGSCVWGGSHGRKLCRAAHWNSISATVSDDVSVSSSSSVRARLLPSAAGDTRLA